MSNFEEVNIKKSDAIMEAQKIQRIYFGEGRNCGVYVFDDHVEVCDKSGVLHSFKFRSEAPSFLKRVETMQLEKDEPSDFYCRHLGECGNDGEPCSSCTVEIGVPSNFIATPKLMLKKTREN